jgi:Holliday junction resolvase RusA-like endonuclease
MFRVEIPIRPSPFQRPRFNNGRGFNDPRYTKYKQALQIVMREQYLDAPLNVPLYVDIVFHYELPKKTVCKYPTRCDLDNLVKAVMDAGNKLLWTDDRLVVKLIASKKYSYQDKIVMFFDCMG